MKSIIFDASTLISLSETCLISALYFLRDQISGKFYVTPAVQREIVSRPLGIRKLEFSAMRLNKLLDDRIIEVIATPNLQAETVRLLGLSNNLFYVNGSPLQLLQAGEAECVASFEGASITAMAADEKTVRQLIEAPLEFSKQIAGEYSGRVQVDDGNLALWRKATNHIKTIRSSELLAVAAGKGFFKDYGAASGEARTAAVYALRNAGCSLSQSELVEFEGLDGKRNSE
ncbi:MAG: hypothetical protein AABW54_00090 [Candidatus Micrarchaeota archaeon]